MLPVRPTKRNDRASAPGGSNRPDIRFAGPLYVRSRRHVRDAVDKSVEVQVARSPAICIKAQRSAGYETNDERRISRFARGLKDAQLGSLPPRGRASLAGQVREAGEHDDGEGDANQYGLD